VEFLKALTGRTYSYVPEDTMPEMLIPLLNDLLTRPVD